MGSVVGEGMAEGTTRSNNVVVPPFNLLLILNEESGLDLFSLSMDNLRDRLLAGIILHDKKESTEKQFFWIDEKSNKNCFLLLPKSLRISAVNGEVPRYVSEKEKEWKGGEIKLTRVKFEGIRHLKVGGKFCTVGLSGTDSEFEVVLILKLLPTGSRRSFYLYTTKKLSLPDGSQTQKPWEPVGIISTEEWHPFQVGTFKMSPNNVGELSFEIQVFFFSRPDILIQGVAIRPPSAKI